MRKFHHGVLRIPTLHLRKVPSFFFLFFPGVPSQKPSLILCNGSDTHFLFALGLQAFWGHPCRSHVAIGTCRMSEDVKLWLLIDWSGRWYGRGGKLPLRQGRYPFLPQFKEGRFDIKSPEI